jgi:hypothetical protein
MDKTINSAPKRSVLFYMANFEPEVARMIKSFETDEKEQAELFRAKTLVILKNIITAPDISIPAREEWTVIKNLVDGFENLSPFKKNILANFGKPFSFQLAKLMS